MHALSERSKWEGALGHLRKVQAGRAWDLGALRKVREGEERVVPWGLSGSHKRRSLVRKLTFIQQS